jgi:pimeloyl-ACP methyl ester carboxylesterase
VFRLLTAVVLVLGIAGCGGSRGSDDSDPDLADAPTHSATVNPGPSADAPDLSSYYTQVIDWQPCAEEDGAEGDECGSIIVPVDYAEPDDDYITMPLIKLSATDPEHRIGSLTMNPGGPGGSGYDLVRYADDDAGLALLRTRFDLVGWDPRGVGRTSAIHCLSDEEMDAYLSTDFSPADDAGRQKVADAQRRYTQGCLRNGGNLLRNMGTEFVVRDLDLLRSALGEEKLDYLGFSYGTLVGEWYAHTFPDRVGRMVLDSVADPGDDEGTRDYQNLVENDPDPGTPGDLDDADRQVGAILADCTTAPDCPLGRDPKAAQHRLAELVDRVRANPIPLPDGRALGVNLLLTAAFQATYQQASWRRLDDGIAEAFDGDATKLAGLADDYVGRQSDGTFSHQQDALWAVNCLVGDAAHYKPDPGPDFMTELATAAEEYRKTSPLFGLNNTFSGTVCSYWPVPPTVPSGPVVAEGVPPILLVSNIGDIATNIDGARRVANSLKGSVLVENQRDEHIAFGKGSECVDGIVTRFFFDGELPELGTRCG